MAVLLYAWLQYDYLQSFLLMCRQHHTGCIGVAPVLYAQVNVSSQNLARYVTLVRHTNAVSVTLPLITKLDENITRVAREKNQSSKPKYMRI